MALDHLARRGRVDPVSRVVLEQQVWLAESPPVVLRVARVARAAHFCHVALAVVAAVVPVTVWVVAHFVVLVAQVARSIVRVPPRDRDCQVVPAARVLMQRVRWVMPVVHCLRRLANLRYCPDDSPLCHDRCHFPRCHQVYPRAAAMRPAAQPLPARRR